MLHFIPAWYQENTWCENEQSWHARRLRTEFDDTVKHIQLFHRSQAYPFQIMLLSFAPNFRHFLHRQSVFHAPYWSCFDAIQEIRKKKVRMFSFHNLQWPEHVEFQLTPFVVMAYLDGQKYAQIQFGEDGNLIEIDMYNKGCLQRRNIYDDRGFVSSSIMFENEKPLYQYYFTEGGVWKMKHFLKDGHVEVNPKKSTYLLQYGGEEKECNFRKTSYDSIDQIVAEVVEAYLAMTEPEDIFCVAMHQLHADILEKSLEEKSTILSFYENRYDVYKCQRHKKMITHANYIITDSQDTMKKLRKEFREPLERITDITPFDSRVVFGISQQLSIQKVLVPVDGIHEDKFEELIIQLAKCIPSNENLRIHLFTRNADYNRKAVLLDKTRQVLRGNGFEESWAIDGYKGGYAENSVEEGSVSQCFFVEQCVNELSVSKCMREQRLIVDMRGSAELYLRIAGISVGIPQIVFRNTQFVENGKNGMVIKTMSQLPQGISYYLDNLANWNEAAVYSYEMGKRYTADVLIEKWKEVISCV